MADKITILYDLKLDELDTSNLKGFNDTFKSLAKEVKAIGTKFNQLNAKTKEMGAMGNTSEKSWSKVLYQAEELYERLARVNEQINDMGDAKINVTNEEWLKKNPDDEYGKGLYSSVVKKERELLSAQQKADELESNYRRTKEEVEAATRAITDAENETRKWSEEVSNLSKSVQSQQTEADKLLRKSKGKNVTDEEKRQLQERRQELLANIDKEYELLEAARKRQSIAYKNENDARDKNFEVAKRELDLPGMKDQYEAADVRVDALATAYNRLNEELEEYIRLRAIEKSASGMNMLGDKAGDIGTGLEELKSRTGEHTIGKNSGSSLSLISKLAELAKTKILELAKSFLKLGKSNKSAMSQSNRGMNKLWKNILQFGLGFRSMYFLVKKLRTTFIDSIKKMAESVPDINTSISSLMTSMNQIKGAIAGAFSPLMTTVIPILNKLLSILNACIEKIGQFFSALTGATSYKFTAAQVDYAKSLKKTGSAAEEASKQLMGFDEINRLNEDTDSGGSGETPFGTWEEQPVSEDMMNLVARIKEAWANADFTDLGFDLGTKLADMLKLAEEKFLPAAQDFFVRLGGSLSTLEKGFFSNFTAASDIGEVIGNFLQSAVEGAYTYMHNMITSGAFQDIGGWLANALNGILSSTKLEEVTYVISGWITKKYAELIGFINELDFGLLGKKLMDCISGVLAMVRDFLGSIDWGTTISNLIHGIFSLVVEFIKELDVRDIFLIILESGKLLQELIVGALDGLVRILADIFRDLGLDSIAGFLDGIHESLANVLASIEEFFGRVIGKVKEILGINSPSKVFSDIGVNVMLGFINGINEKIQAIKKLFSDMWQGIKDTAINLWNSITESVSTKLLEIEERVGSILSSIKNKWDTAWNNMRNTISSVWQSIKNFVIGGINGVIGGINGMISGLVSGINAVIGVLNRLSFTIPAWVPQFGGKQFGFSIGYVTAPQIPYLAQGAVIPPNEQFLAVLGDQKRGTNIEAPLSTIEEAVSNVLNDRMLDTMIDLANSIVTAIENKNTVIKLDKKVVGQAAKDYIYNRSLATG